ncbi:hypothetical protein C0989_006887, partial [Termitomyces sp. Mn162]
VKQKMPLSTSSHAPKFTHTQPSEVLHFLQKMGTLFENAGITSAKEKKKRIVEYVNAVTEKEWRGFDSFEDDKSWDEFVKELKDLCPEAIDNVGQVSYLDCICGGSNVAEIHSLIRKFKGEAKLLSKVLHNSTLVNKFMQGFTPTFADVIKDKLLSKYGHFKDAARNRHEDDQYDLSEVIAVVTALVGRKSLHPDKTVIGDTDTVSTKERFKEEKSEEKLAHLQDSILAIGKQVQAVQSGQAQFKTAFLTAKNNVRVDGAAPALHSTLATSSAGVTAFDVGNQDTGLMSVNTRSHIS